YRHEHRVEVEARQLGEDFVGLSGCFRGGIAQLSGESEEGLAVQEELRCSVLDANGGQVLRVHRGRCEEGRGEEAGDKLCGGLDGASSALTGHRCVKRVSGMASAMA